ncbi:MAG: hypothetical protein K0S08_2157 [Gammaproteobacteria bacterium]|jgi:hypothetical protein|nr:hypothetical protein [Gammaproteobacteria bacterium]
MKINQYTRTAIIYSLDDVFAYIVEIKEGDKSYYICMKNNEPVQFGNMADARQAALDKNAKEAYLALSKTYEENDLTTAHGIRQPHYDYIPLSLPLRD